MQDIMREFSPIKNNSYLPEIFKKIMPQKAPTSSIKIKKVQKLNKLRPVENFAKILNESKRSKSPIRSITPKLKKKTASSCVYLELKGKKPPSYTPTKAMYTKLENLIY